MTFYRLYRMYRNHGSTVSNAIRRAWENINYHL